VLVLLFWFCYSVCVWLCFQIGVPPAHWEIFWPELWVLVLLYSVIVGVHVWLDWFLPWTVVRQCFWWLCSGVALVVLGLGDFCGGVPLSGC
jgi:hypothetical protein